MNKYLKKYPAVILLFILTQSTLFPVEESNSWPGTEMERSISITRDSENNIIKKTVLDTFNRKIDGPDEYITTIQERVFDKNNNLIYEYLPGPDGSAGISENNYKYNENNQIVYKKIHHFGGGAYNTKEFSYKYNLKGMLFVEIHFISSTDFEEGFINSVKFFSYDKNMNLTGIREIKNKDHKKKSIKVIYDDNDKIQKVIHSKGVVIIENEDSIIDQIKVLKIESSSYNKWNKNVYHPFRCFDNNPKTAWIEDVAGEGINEFIELQLADKILIDKIIFMPGFFDRKWWGNNNRVKKLQIEANNSTEYVNFKDIMVPSEFNFKNKISFDKIRFTIKEVFSSTVDNDTAISEVHFFNGIRKIEFDLVEFEKSFNSGGEDFTAGH